MGSGSIVSRKGSCGLSYFRSPLEGAGQVIRLTSMRLELVPPPSAAPLQPLTSCRLLAGHVAPFSSSSGFLISDS